MRAFASGGGVVLPAQPRLCRFDAGGFIGAVQARPVGGDHVGALAFWNIGLVAVPAFGEDPARTAAGLCEPAVLDLAAEEHAAHDQAGRTRGMGLRIGQRQRRAPRAAVDQPAFDAQMLTHLLDVGHQRLRPQTGDGDGQVQAYSLGASEGYRMPQLYAAPDPEVGDRDPRAELAPTTICLQVVVDADGGVERSLPLTDRAECTAGAAPENAPL
ncbi:hypothetical protein G6F23_013567 [Rhizopus arrhizus]|nr:hypothetical protein G6F23_013567 [Rhizopus arrhizus]